MTGISVSRPIDGRGMKRERRMVAHIQKLSRRNERMAAAQAKRDRRAARRADGSRVIVICGWPQHDVSYSAAAGCYVQGGDSHGGRYQIMVVGDLVGTMDDYRDAVCAWTGRKLRIAEQGQIKKVEPEPHWTDGDRALAARSFLSVILEPETT